MPLNLIKEYNQLLELDHLNEPGRTRSLKNIFNRDIKDNSGFCFRNKQIYPIWVEGADPVELLFTHLTTHVINPQTRERGYDALRSKRLHWIRFHTEESKADKMLIFSADDKDGIRTYIYDQDESYVIVLEPYRKGTGYYLLTAYHVDQRNVKKIQNKYKRRLSDIY